MVRLLTFVSLSPLFLAAPSVLAAPPVRLDAAGDCPSEARISAELEAIVSSREGAPGAADVARIETRDGVLVVTLTSPDGARLGERRLHVAGDCDAQARAVAVIVATFLADLHPEYLTLLPAPPPEAPAEPEPVEAPTSPSPSPAEPAPAPAPASAALPSPRPEPAPVPALAYPRDEWLLAVAAGVELNSELVPAAELSLSFLPGGRGFGARAFALVPGAAGRELDESVATFARYPLGVGALFRVGQRDAWLDAGAGVAVAWLHVEGRTFARNSSADDWVIGPFASVRAGTEWGGVRPFAELGVLGWPGESVLISRTPAASATLPRVEGSLLLGAGLPL